MKHEAIERPGEITQKAHASLRDEQLDPQEPIFSGAYIDAVSGPHHQDHSPPAVSLPNHAAHPSFLTLSPTVATICFSQLSLRDYTSLDANLSLHGPVFLSPTSPSHPISITKYHTLAPLQRLDTDLLVDNAWDSSQSPPLLGGHIFIPCRR